MSFNKLIYFVLLICFACVHSENEDIEPGETNTKEEIKENPASDHPIHPNDYVLMLGKGFDVQWSQFNKSIEAYNEQSVIDLEAAGFSNVRIRTNKEPESDLFVHMDQQIEDCLKHNIIPILAYGAEVAEDSDDLGASKIHVVNWWKKVADHYKSYSHKLAFNVFIEISGTIKDDYETVNSWYIDILDAIRESNPYRIVIFPPVHISDPNYLQYLHIPEPSDEYTMAEWHFYAAGPKPDVESKQWTTGTVDERNTLVEKIQLGLDWMKENNKPTWVGAWMAGNYSKGNDYDIPEQVGFATFMVRELEKAGIPWSVNSHDKYYDLDRNVWYTETLDMAGIPVRDVILDTERISLYEHEVYGGNSVRLAPGNYDKAELESIGFFKNIGSIMIPLDYKVEIYDETGFKGQLQVYEMTISETPFLVKSLIVLDKRNE